MTRLRKPLSFFVLSLPAVVLLCFFPAAPPAQAGPKAEAYWNVDDVRAGMKGVGRTVMKGTKVENFDAEVLGVLKNTSPGRDMVLCRLSGLGLEKTGVIAGMSGSPVYIDGKLLGAVAYAWAYGKEPIAGVTPFCQMHGFVEAYERRDLAEQGQADARRPAPAAAHRRQGASTRVTVVAGLATTPEPTAGRRPVDGAAADAAGRHRLHAAQPEAAARALRRGTAWCRCRAAALPARSPTRRRTRRWNRAARWPSP